MRVRDRDTMLLTCVVALLRLLHQPLLLEGVGQVTVGIREVGLQLNGSPVCVHRQVNESLLVVDTGQVTMDNGMVGRQVQSSQIRSNSSEVMIVNELFIHWKDL